MDDHDHELLKWIAEELLGWKYHSFYRTSHYPTGIATDHVELWERPGMVADTIEERSLSCLESWHGIGLVVGKMWQRKFFFDLWKRGDWHAEFHEWEERKGKIVAHDEPWFAVYEAARKAVTND